MFQYSRLEEIFNAIKSKQFSKPSILSIHLNITERTLRTDIANINEMLKKYSAEIKLKRNYGYHLIIHDTHRFNQFLVKLEDTKDHLFDLETSEDRLKYILNILLNAQDFINMDTLADSVYISKNTLQNYLKTIKKILAIYQLEYINKTNVGIKVIGNESDKRQCIIENVLSYDANNYIVSFTKEEKKLFEEIDLESLRTIVVANLSSIILKTSDMNLKNLVIHISLMITRIKHDCYINLDSKVVIPNDIKIKIDKLCKTIETQYNIVISEGEKQYLYLHLIANTDCSVGDVNDDLIEDSVNKLLEIIYFDYNFDLRNDEILCKDLFVHFKSILSNKAYSLNKRNPLLNTIKNNFPLAYEITLTATSKIFEGSYKLNEDEVGYVSLHIGAAIERCFSGSIDKKSVILVCGSGQATTRMLEARLNVFFNDKIIIVRKSSYKEFTSYTSRELKNIDFIISTIPLQSDIIPTITVDFALNKNDIEAISKFLVSIDSNKLKKSNRFFDTNLFVKFDRQVSKEEVLKTLCDKLKKNHMVNNHFYQSLMERENLAKTNMNEVFAIPHPMELCALDTKVAVALLDYPTQWYQNESVQIIFLLAIKQGDQQNIEHLYDIFIEIVNNPKLQQALIHAQTFDDFLQALYDYIVA
ncbi:MAG: transcription antiterminator [Erysipelotrichia bacterium]|nr:transcription antiterminator [Erysipelotrichia bacterium]NCC54013.1 transcription antiterminator [Erysipelotrichia bacterium]